MEAEVGRVRSQAKEHLGSAEAGRGRKHPSPEPQREHSPSQFLISSFLSPEPVKE